MVAYQHADALGSLVVSTNAARMAIGSSEHEPFDRVGNRAMRDGMRYTGHAEDMAAGLTSTIRFRWLSSDWLLQGGGKIEAEIMQRKLERMR